MVLQIKEKAKEDQNKSNLSEIRKGESDYKSEKQKNIIKNIKSLQITGKNYELFNERSYRISVP